MPSRVALHPLPNGVLAEAHEARPHRYALLADQVVLVDPVTMRVVDDQALNYARRRPMNSCDRSPPEVGRRDADSEGEDDRGLTASDTKTR